MKQTSHQAQNYESSYLNYKAIKIFLLSLTCVILLDYKYCTVILIAYYKKISHNY